MKSIWVIAVLAFCFSGCSAQETFETIGVMDEVPDAAQAWEIAVDLPSDLVSAAMGADNTGSLYICDDYTLTMQTMPSGDLNQTFVDCTGFPKDELQIMKTQINDQMRYEAVWTSVSEAGDQVGRIAVLDDGDYHYVLTVMANADKVGEISETWQMLFRSFRIVEPGSMVNSGS